MDIKVVLCVIFFGLLCSDGRCGDTPFRSDLLVQYRLSLIELEGRHRQIHGSAQYMRRHAIGTVGESSWVASVEFARTKDSGRLAIDWGLPNDFKSYEDEVASRTNRFLGEWCCAYNADYGFEAFRIDPTDPYRLNVCGPPKTWPVDSSRGLAAS
jgi:hypothetical protein